MESEIPSEVASIARFKSVWYAAAALALVVSALLVAHAIPTKDYGGWLTWLGVLFQAAYVTLTLFLVLLTYKLFRIAATATVQSEKIQRAARLPIVVADVAAFAEDRNYKIWLANEGDGPAFDVRVDVDYGTPEPQRETGFRFGAIKKEGQCGPFFVDMPPYEANLLMRISYKDIYGQEGVTVYEAPNRIGSTALELVSLQPPVVEPGSRIAPLIYERTSNVTALRANAFHAHDESVSSNLPAD